MLYRRIQMEIRNLLSKTYQWFIQHLSFIPNSECIVKEELRHDRFGVESQQSKNLKDRASNLLMYSAYCGSNLQAILQSVFLWKRPLICFQWNLDTGG